MKKETIYIDTEDDITSIIEKVANATESVVALVPPKRIGILQSIVNLKLLQRAAKNAGKQIVLVTNDTALVGLAGELSLPVAKNLQSKPEVNSPSTPESEDDDVIDGATLPAAAGATAAAGVGAVAGATALAGAPAAEAAPLAETPHVGSDLDNVEAEGTAKAVGVDEEVAASTGAKKAKKTGVAIPNFDGFRKKLFLIVGGVVALAAFLVWAIIFAPHATIAITARTNIVNIAQDLQLANGGTVDPAQKTLPAVVKQVKKTASVDFQATGQKDVGEKATGSVTVAPTAETLIKVISDDIVVPAGTPVTSTSGATFQTTTALTFSYQNLKTTKNGQATPVIATKTGASSNGASGTAKGPSGFTTTFVGATSGGTDKTVTVVSQADIDQAKSQLKSDDQNQIKAELKKQFGDGDMIVEESFSVNPGSPSSTPAAGAEASSAHLTADTTYTLVGVKRTDLKAVFDNFLKSKIANDSTQKIYASGDNDVNFSDFQSGDNNSYSVHVSANAQVGPNIDKNAVAEQSKGKREGEIQQSLESIQGVEKADVTFSPFWVKSAPSDTKKIDVTFVLKNDKN